MIWLLEQLYTTETARLQPIDVAEALTPDSLSGGVYLIALDTDGDHPLEIVQAGELTKEYYPQRDLLIIGAARNEKQAQRLLLTMTDDVVAETGAADLAAYFREQWENGKTMEIPC